MTGHLESKIIAATGSVMKKLRFLFQQKNNCHGDGYVGRQSRTVVRTSEAWLCASGVRLYNPMLDLDQENTTCGDYQTSPALTNNNSSLFSYKSAAGVAAPGVRIAAALRVESRAAITRGNPTCDDRYSW